MRKATRILGRVGSYLWIYFIYLLSLYLTSYEMFKTRELIGTIISVTVVFCLFVIINHLLVKRFIPQKNLIIIEVLLLMTIFFSIISYSCYIRERILR